MIWQTAKDRERGDGDGEEDERKQSQLEDMLSGRLADIKSIQPLQHRDQYLHPQLPIGHPISSQDGASDSEPSTKACEAVAITARVRHLHGRL
ncbi:hypothetical protein GTR04_0773 [Trichophyton interdigitale]|uniref:Uncharacterized protein n=1 Tax=Trichophyton interdigitale TaxID=101480 RepID=A0A9P5CXX5_9EURO|nr:hypothetical protein GY631_0519 [Trichophyton interdigitale]KAF3900821.1 hypothetical protein GY632_0451 [Trichophyton interdigitale]KAG8211791.1 hypothetical protein GTR04_0773 [Trichophyton interdigitale]